AELALGGVDDDELGAAVLAAAVAERELVLGGQRPARQDEIAVPALAVGGVELVEGGVGAEPVGEDVGLVVGTRPLDVGIDFLKANEVGLFGTDDIDDTVESIPPISPAHAFVDIVGQ